MNVRIGVLLVPLLIPLLLLAAWLAWWSPRSRRPRDRRFPPVDSGATALAGSSVRR